MNLIPEPQELTFQPDKHYILPDEATLYMPKHDHRLVKGASSLFSGLSSRSPSDGLYALFCGCGSLCLPEALSPGSFKEPPVSEAYDLYEILVTEQYFLLRSPSPAGLFYGIQTMKQLMETYGREIPLLHIRDWAFTALRMDHYDLRTIHPTYQHLEEYIRVMASYKINGLLIEYEDKLPFADLKILRHPHGLTNAQLQSLLAAARENFIEVIPLQQTYGHLEYVLKHPDFIHLREQPNQVAELCPMKEESLSLIRRLLKDISDLHPHSRYLHLGGDEVRNIGTCALCRASGMSSSALFIRFMNQVAACAIELGKQPIIWHDMLKDAGDEEIALLDKRILVAVWLYSGRDLKKRAVSFVEKFRRAGLTVLGAPSVRCWDDSAAQNYPVAQRRLFNLASWKEVNKEYRLSGLIFTNWSASFALGNPYGLLETTRYLTFYGCEQAWNPEAAQESYPRRFFALFHGIVEQEFLSEHYTLEDYYLISRLYLPLCRKNRLTARLLHIMQQYDDVLVTGLPIQDMLFRADMCPENEEIITFLRENYKKNYGMLDHIRPEMEEILEELLPPAFIPLYLHSRFYLPELYRREARKLLGI
ncbi:MAG: beta-N-acetylhexosaminidase [Acetatifactor sp.]|nr:beta-N-acetylhexosaminidase [Acetatifactor sp.]